VRSDLQADSRAHSRAIGLEAKELSMDHTDVHTDLLDDQAISATLPITTAAP
jgi:hypothetical protein